MSLRIIRPGLQTTVQAAPRRGLRHLGVPSSGSADPLSMALANRLLGNPLLAPALETTLTGIECEALEDLSIAITGAAAECSVAGRPAKMHEVLRLAAGETLSIAPATAGLRNYLAVAGGFEADEILGSRSTYLPAGLGGYRGRALRRGDVVSVADRGDCPQNSTPAEYRPRMSAASMLRASRSLETAFVDAATPLFDVRFIVGERNDRMGIGLEGDGLSVRSDGRMASAPVFPGMVQCPEGGQPFLLSVDAQTTGGYPRVAKVIRADLHQIGQLRPGDRLTFIERRPEVAARELREKHAYWRAWLPDIRAVI